MSHVEDVTAEQARKYMAGHDEHGYELIDVRQPGEYQAGHIPGARLLPLSDLMDHVFDLEPDKDYLFYCRSGNRSRSAAEVAVEAELGGRIMSLTGGILGWNGLELPDFPPLEDFAPRGDDVAATLEKAFELEKGAYLFYRGLAQNPPQNVVCMLLDELAGAKVSNARVVYGYLETEGFDEHFQQAEGRILAEGRSVDDLVDWARRRPGGCLGLTELALTLECRAYDLYRNLAAKLPTQSEAFLALAQREKQLIAPMLTALEQSARYKDVQEK